MKAHQRIIREKEAKKIDVSLFPNPWKNIEISIEKSIVREIDRATAKIIILRYEWLGTLPDNTTKYFGLFIDGLLAGVSCFTTSVFGGSSTLYGFNSWILNRGACVHWCPDWGGSFLVTQSCKILFKNSEPTYVVAFSDWDAGEIGTIYQACNWAYLGEKRSMEWISPKGKRHDINMHKVAVISGSMRTKTGAKATKEEIKESKDRFIAKGWKMQKGAIRGKYAYVYGRKCKDKREMIKLLKENSKPYPKREP
jgi:hypothetical protein